LIPDIALMIFVYGSARLATAVLEPHRKGTGGTWPQVATSLSWIAAIGAIGVLAFLALDVLHSSASVPGLTR
jgi:hypothetical protein